MENLGKKVGFLKGLLEGMDFEDNAVNGKLMAGIVDLLGDLSDRVEAIDELLDDLNDYVESIDGDLSDWNLDSPAVVDKDEQVIRDYNMWMGVEDLSAKFYLAWDEDNLYMAAQVNEDTPLGAIEMLPIDGEDNLKRYISTNPDSDPARLEYDTWDWLIYLIMDEPYWDTAIDRSMVTKDKALRFISTGMDGGESVIEGYECGVQMTTTGFNFECVIPLYNLSGENPNVKRCTIEKYVPKAGDVLLCNFEITDISYPCPGTEYIPQLAWSGNYKIQTNPSLWGTVTLAE